ncbi:ATP-binding protein [Actinomadura sp. 9N215]|uniref:ATP-binding protein n=1 Tax=Actinomadura sp. 9N215 TaxID=3375150 RepID=UPI00379A6288
MTKAAAACGIPWRLETGGCAVIPLPPDESIAAVARSQVRGLLPALGLSVEDVHDLAVMVSELATNVFQHAMSGDGLAGAELWVYQRSGEQGHDELVVKAFDTLREWRRPAAPPQPATTNGTTAHAADSAGTGPTGGTAGGAGDGATSSAGDGATVRANDGAAGGATGSTAGGASDGAPGDATGGTAGGATGGSGGGVVADAREHGRGLEIIEILANGRWGHHPSRSRLRSPAVRGKATWFALPVTRTVRRHSHFRPAGEPDAMRDLEAMLVQRGVDRLQRSEELGVTMLSAPGDLTVWCETAMFRWCARSGETGKLPVSDITEVCEQVVQLHEALDDRI